jgi:hypothetical protein
MHNKFLSLLPGIVLNCVFKVFPFILVICVDVYLKKNKKVILICFLSFLQNFVFVLQ